MTVNLIKDDYLILYAYRHRRLTEAQTRRVDDLIDKAIGYAWGWTDAGGKYPGESSSDAAWKFAHWYGVIIAEFEAGVRSSHGPIAEAWRTWCALQGRPIDVGGRILTASDANALATILSAAQRNATVGRLLAGTVFSGTATNVCDATGATLAPRADIRDTYLRVLGVNGVVVHLWPIADLMADMPNGGFVVDYREHAA
jgi:hypothetical protein